MLKNTYSGGDGTVEVYREVAEVGVDPEHSCSLNDAFKKLDVIESINNETDKNGKSSSELGSEELRKQTGWLNSNLNLEAPFVNSGYSTLAGWSGLFEQTQFCVENDPQIKQKQNEPKTFLSNPSCSSQSCE